MKLKHLRQILEGKDENLEIFIKKTNDEFEYSLLEYVGVGKIDFPIEEEDGVIEKAQETCLILTDDI